MDNSFSHTSVPIQRRWKQMLEKNEMQIFVSSSRDYVNCTVSLNMDMKGFAYIIGKKESQVEIYSIANVHDQGNDSQSFTIELSTKEKLVFKTSSVTCSQNWVHGMKKLVENQRYLHDGDKRRDQWLREMFQAFQTTNNHELKYKDILKHVLNAKKNSVSPAFFKHQLKEYLKSKNMKYKEDDGFPILQNFMEFYKLIFDRKELISLFKRIAPDGNFISISALEYFMTEEQHQSVTQEQCRELILLNEVTQVGKQNLQLGFDGFVHLMTSTKQELFNPEHDHIYQDMRQPLPHYYIASSHNTYLCGKQLSGDSSPEAYSYALERGCRCVELDCWDGDDDEPIVYHGYTLTTKILFKDIIKAIDNSAFMTSPYPVIVSLENHCSVEAQKKMASYLVEIFGDKLYTTPVDKKHAQFPSPEFFKNKILVRGKVGSHDDKESSSEQHEEKQERKKGKELKEREDEKIKSDSTPSVRKTEITSSKTKEKKDDEIGNKEKLKCESEKERKISSSKKKVADELSNLINYMTNVKFSSFEESYKSVKFWHSSSFVEGEMLEHYDNNPEEFIQYNRCQLSRIYPGGMRIDSSNYSPVTPWNIGCQIVALNHQTQDEGMAMYYGKFRQNGGAGYILKPKFLRDSTVKFNPNTTEPTSGSKLLKMTVISGQQLPDDSGSWTLVKDEPDPYVQVKIQGIKADCFSFTTSTFYDNCFNPEWNETFETAVLVPELAMVKFTVYDKDIGFDDFMGEAVIPLESCQEGYGHLPLIDKDGVAIPCASIFVHVSIQDLQQKYAK